MRASSASALSRVCLPRSMALSSWRAACALPRSAWASVLSSSTTSMPTPAATCATPAPIMPAPSTPSLPTLGGGTSAGRLASLSSRPLLMNSVRIRLRATGSASRRPKYLRSTRSPASSGSCVPSSTQDRIASGAGRLRCVWAASSVAPAVKLRLACGAIGPAPPGTRKPLASHGCTAWGCASSRRLAAATTSPWGASSWTMPSFKASPAFTWRPVSSRPSAFSMPIRRGRRCVPPPAGSRPMPTSDRPTPASGWSANTRWWQASASSNPPPSADPSSAAANGLPQVSMRRASRPKASPSVAPCAAGTGPSSSSASMPLMSAPAMKVPGLPETRMAPRTPGDVATCSTASARSAINSGVSTFTGRSARSISISAMPSSPVRNSSVFMREFRSRVQRVSDAFDDGGGGLPCRRAQRDEPRAQVAALQFVEHGADQHRPRGPQRVAQCDRAAIDVDALVRRAGGPHVAKHHRGEGLVDLEQIDVTNGHARAAQGLLRGRGGTVEHQGRLAADGSVGPHPGARTQARAAAEFRRSDQDRGGPIDHAAGRARGVQMPHRFQMRIALQRNRVEAPLFAHGIERRLECRQAFRRDIGARKLVARQHHLADHVAHRNERAVETPAGHSLRTTELALKRIGIELLARVAVQRGQQVGRYPGRREVGLPDHLRIADPGPATGERGHTRHRFHATGDDGVDLPCHDLRGREVDGLQPGSAEPVDLYAGHVLPVAGHQGRQTSDVSPLLAIGTGTAQDHVVHQRGVERMPLAQGSQHLRCQLHRRDLVQRTIAAPPPARGAQMVVDEGTFHEICLRTLCGVHEGALLFRERPAFDSSLSAPCARNIVASDESRVQRLLAGWRLAERLAPTRQIALEIHVWRAMSATPEYRSLSLRRSSLPVSVRGSAANSIRRGHLKCAIFERQNCISSSARAGEAVWPGLSSMTAMTSWPRSGFGTPITPTSSTAGCSISTSSVSRG